MHKFGKLVVNVRNLVRYGKLEISYELLRQKSLNTYHCVVSVQKWKTLCDSVHLLFIKKFCWREPSESYLWAEKH